LGASSGCKEVKVVSSTIPDWSREKPKKFWDPGRKLLLAIRQYQIWRERKGMLSFIMQKWMVFRHTFWTVIVNSDIPLNCNIGGGLLIPHPNGVVIHPKVKIGVNCLIFQQVTIGGRGTEQVPIIEGHVDIGAGAKILGGVHVGAHAKIGANSVVIHDVPSVAVAVGVPAKIVN